MNRKEDIFKILFLKYLDSGYELLEEDIYLGKQYILNNSKNGFRILIYYELRDCFEKIQIYNEIEHREYLNFVDGKYTSKGGLKTDYLDTHINYIMARKSLSQELQVLFFAVAVGILLYDNEAVLLVNV